MTRDQIKAGLLLGKAYLELWKMKQLPSELPFDMENHPVILEAKRKLWEAFLTATEAGIGATATCKEQYQSPALRSLLP